MVDKKNYIEKSSMIMWGRTKDTFNVIVSKALTLYTVSLKYYKKYFHTVCSIGIKKRNLVDNCIRMSTPSSRKKLDESYATTSNQT